MQSESLIGLSPRERRVIVGNISAIFQEIKLGTLTLGDDLRQGAIEVVHLFAEACEVGAICEVSFAVNDG